MHPGRCLVAIDNDESNEFTIQRFKFHESIRVSVDVLSCCIGSNAKESPGTPKTSLQTKLVPSLARDQLIRPRTSNL
jgi:hypothetical protein